MKKHMLCLFTAALLLLSLLPASALTPCEHYPGQVADYELEEVNKVSPQEGVSGSVDLACPICHQIVDSVILPALPAPAEHPAASDAESPQAPKPAAQPEQKPAEKPAQPEKPVQPEAPVQPETPAQPETQTQPETPPQSGISAQPENQAPQSGGTTQATVPEVGDTGPATGTNPPKSASKKGESEQTPTPAPASPKVSTRSGSVPQQNPASAEGSGLTSFPFRRVKMRPKPDIFAEAAGELLWPLYGTPFQQLYND